MPRGLRVRFWYGLYNLCVHAGLLFCIPVWVLMRIGRGRYTGQFRERRGLLSPAVAGRFGRRPALWIHAASAGETASAVPLVRRLRQALPDRPFFFTVTSPYGKQMAERQLGDVVDGVSFSPLDIPLYCRRLLRQIQPCLYIMVETDLWPNLVRLAKRSGAVVVIASGHAGPATFPRPFWRAVFAQIDAFLMQTEADARNIVRRGAAPAQVATMGNLKFDSIQGLLPASRQADLRDEFGLPAGVRLLVAGSTLAEDEGPVLDAIQGLRGEGVPLWSIVAPRRKERVGELARACAQRGLDAALRSRGGSAPVLILDTMGELARTYNLADVAYVGGGFTPEVGLHNLLEPLVCGAPVLFGPNHGKAARVAAEFLRLGAGVEVADGPGLLAAVRTALTDEESRQRWAQAGQALLDRHCGASREQARRILELMA